MSHRADPVLSPAVVGVLGGGQLGRYALLAARTMGFGTVVLDPDALAPAGRIADEHLVAPFDDPAALDRLAEICAVVTTEFENPPVDALRRLVAESKKEHDEVKELVAELQGMSPDDENVEDKLEELRDAVLHHASEEEEGKMFPRVHKAFDADELEQLGKRLQQRKRALLDGPIGRMTRAVKKGLRKVA